MLLLIGFWGFFATCIVWVFLYLYFKEPTPEEDRDFFYFFRSSPLFSTSDVRRLVPGDKIHYFEILIKVRVFFFAVLVLGFLTGCCLDQNWPYR